MRPAPRHFDVCGPLPEPGVTILEASAGTGKTFTIAALVARLVAEGIAPLSEILVVTFTRKATGELRDRVRARLVSAESGLGRLLDAGEALPAGDEVLQLLGTDSGRREGAGDGGPVRERRGRLATALANFDGATITTTHGFCHAVVAALGVWGEVGPGAELLEDPHDLVEEVVDDLFARHVLSRGPLPFRRGQALAVGIAAVTNPGTPLGPPADRIDVSAPGLRRRLAEGTRKEVARRLLDANLLTYDDLLVRLAKALSDADRGPVACSRLRERYRVVLVDEFQDTDGAQWDIVRHAFTDGATRLVLIGDPKQAVYAFRGADVYAYLDAARAAAPDHRFTLDENWRSDADLLASYDALLGPLHLGHPEIVYRQAHAAPVHSGSALRRAPVGAPLRARLLGRALQGPAHTGRGLIRKDSALKWVADDLAADVVALLGSGAELLHRGPKVPAGEGAWAAVGPQDIGVLVRTNRQATIVQASLRSAGVPVVVSGAQSVLATPAARDWLRLLEALEQPSARSPAVAAGLTALVGMTAAQLATADERTWEALHARLHEWAALVRRSGVATLFAHVSVSQRLPARLLGEIEGERRLTDLGHISELLHAEVTRSQLGLAALRAWLARRIDEANPEGAEAEQRSRRLDSDSAAVQILTVHRAKGLEFPIVYCPYLWDGNMRDRFGAPIIFHDPSDGDRRKLDVGGESGDHVYEEHYLASQAEKSGEDLRHLYVALTRAKHQVVLWWAPVQDCQHSALGRLLLAKGPTGDVAPDGRSHAPKDPEVAAAFAQVAGRAPGLVSIEAVQTPAPGRWQAGTRPDLTDKLQASSFDRDLDLGWRRLSYTAITAAAYALHCAGPVVGSEPESAGMTDEPVAAIPVGVPLPSGSRGAPGGPLSVAGPRSDGRVRQNDEQLLLSTPSLLAAMPAGADVGIFVHSVLEQVDFSAGDLSGALAAALGAQVAGYPGDPGDIGMLATGLEAAISTPLGAPVGGASLADVRRADRLDELRFELPLAGGDRPAAEVVTADLAGLFRRHIGTGQPLAAYGPALAAPELAANLRGYLTGSLDLVFRLRGGGGSSDRYFVADYKTNWLGAPGEALSLWDYRTSALEAEMRRAHYPLQALLYLVALHRYLRWRLPGYDPAANLGGALYLFIGGMGGPGAPGTGNGQPSGVFSWEPPAALVIEASDLLAGTAPALAGEAPGSGTPAGEAPGSGASAGGAPASGLAPLGPVGDEGGHDD
jgi:exodeoxyribonuclease V beta subunit